MVQAEAKARVIPHSVGHSQHVIAGADALSVIHASKSPSVLLTGASNIPDDLGADRQRLV